MCRYRIQYTSKKRNISDYLKDILGLKGFDKVLSNILSSNDFDHILNQFLKNTIKM